MSKNGPLPALVGSSLIVAGLCALMLKDGWLVLVPTILALLVVTSFGHRTPSR
jgi:uncharacterized membrane protein YjjP (DUF1212 family)